MEINKNLRKKAKNEFQKNFFKLINNGILKKAMRNVRKYRYIKLLTIEKRKNCLVSEPNYLTTNIFSENLLALEMRKTDTYEQTNVIKFINIRIK